VKSLLRLRQALAVAAVITLAACNAAQNVSLNVGAGSNPLSFGPSRITFNHGGRFTAAYSGAYNKSGDCSATATFTYNGSGKARFLHSSNDQSKLIWYCGSQRATGSAQLTSIHDPRDSITASVRSADFKGPCYGFTMTFTVTGGTGRFRHASGSGAIVVNTLSSGCVSYSYSDKWKGTLKF
jgi:hypothetical protein